MTSPSRADRDHAGLMDGVYRYQRHIYDITRKYFLLGRDNLISEMKPRGGTRVLELGCGTGRNLLLAAERYPDTRLYGLDISEAMLDTARGAIERAGRSGAIALAEADASHFDVRRLFSVDAMDHVFISYALSMIPPWERTIEAGLTALAPGGTLHIVDFGDQAGLPSAFRRILRAWLSRFHVEPRSDLVAVAERAAIQHGASLRFTPLYRGYAWQVTITLPPR